MTTWRAFIAVDLTPEMRTQLDSLTGRMRRLTGQQTLRFAAASGIHLTLKFLGEISTDLAGGLHAVLDEAASRVRPFPVRVRGVGCFPSSRQPRVLWVGLEDHGGDLRTLQQAVETGSARLGLPKEDRPFSPHLTLARVRRDAGPEAAACVRFVLESEAGLDLGEMPIEAIHLFRSELRPSGAVYSRLHTAALGAGA